MFTITNNSKVTPIGLPNGVVIQPGETRPVTTWLAMRDNVIVRAWIKQGIIKVSGEQAAPASVSQSAIVADEKDAILAKLAALGIKKDRRTSLANLQTALKEAEAI